MPTLKDILTNQASALATFETASALPLPRLSAGLSVIAQSLPVGGLALPVLPSIAGLPAFRGLTPAAPAAPPARNQNLGNGVRITYI